MIRETTPVWPLAGPDRAANKSRNLPHIGFLAATAEAYGAGHGDAIVDAYTAQFMTRTGAAGGLCEPTHSMVSSGGGLGVHARMAASLDRGCGMGVPFSRNFDKRAPTRDKGGA